MSNETQAADVVVQGLARMAHFFETAGVPRSDVLACMIGWAAGQAVADGMGPTLAASMRKMADRIEAGDLSMMTPMGEA